MAKIILKIGKIMKAGEKSFKNRKNHLRNGEYHFKRGEGGRGLSAQHPPSTEDSALSTQQPGRSSSWPWALTGSAHVSHSPEAARSTSCPVQRPRRGLGPRTPVRGGAGRRGGRRGSPHRAPGDGDGDGDGGLSAQHPGTICVQAGRTQRPAPSLHRGLSTQHSETMQVDQLSRSAASAGFGASNPGPRRGWAEGRATEEPAQGTWGRGRRTQRPAPGDGLGTGTDDSAPSTLRRGLSTQQPARLCRRQDFSKKSAVFGLRQALGRGHRRLSTQHSGAVLVQARSTQLPAPSLHRGLSTQHSAARPVEQLALGSDWLRSCLP